LTQILYLKLRHKICLSLTLDSNLMKSFFAIFLVLFLSNSLLAQVYEQPAPENIQTINFNGGTEQSQLPMIRLGAPLKLSFDDLNADEEDYYYKLSHHNFDWTLSDLSKGEYLDGFDEMRIRIYENSLNTLQLFAHYTLTIPNRDTRRIKKSGNYLITIYKDTGELIFSRKFMVIEQKAGIKVDIKRSRNFEFIETKQVVQFSINTSGLNVANPKQTINTVLIKNNNLKTAILNLKPQYTIGAELIYRYDQESAFWGGNEYFNFDNSELRGANSGVRRVEIKNIYHSYLFTNGPRFDRPYTYNPDINGNFVVRNLNVLNPNIEAEYVWIHFSLQYYEDLEGKEIHLYGNFNNFNLDETTRMRYNSESRTFEGVRKFKQGFYNYKYVLLDADGNLDEGAIGGNFWQTENEYTVLVYYRELGGRYDKIIGYGKSNSEVITNN